MKDDKEETMQLAARLREMVEAIGTQAKAAEVAKISPRQITTYLAGETKPTFLVVARLAEASGFNPLYVMTGRGSKTTKLPEFPEAMIEFPGNIAATLEVRRKQLDLLLNLYRSSAWPVEEGEEDELIIDSLQQVMSFPPDLWDQAIDLVEASHAAALRHIQPRAVRRRRGAPEN